MAVRGDRLLLLQQLGAEEVLHDPHRLRMSRRYHLLSVDLRPCGIGLRQVAVHPGRVLAQEPLLVLFHRVLLEEVFFFSGGHAVVQIRQTHRSLHGRSVPQHRCKTQRVHRTDSAVSRAGLRSPATTAGERVEPSLLSPPKDQQAGYLHRPPSDQRHERTLLARALAHAPWRVVAARALARAGRTGRFWPTARAP